MSVDSDRINVSQVLGVQQQQTQPKKNENLGEQNAGVLASDIKQEVNQQAPAATIPSKKSLEDVIDVPDSEQLADLVERVQDFVSTFDNRLQFSVDESSGRSVVSVVDSKTGDLVRQIPSEEMLKLVQNLSDNSVFIDTKI